MKGWEDYWSMKDQEAQQKLQIKVDDQAKQLVAAANEEIEHTQQAFAEGQKKSQIVTRTVYLKGQSYAETNVALNNPACRLDADGVSILSAARSSLLPAAASSVSNPAMSGARANPAGGAGVQGRVPAAPPGRSGG